MTKLKEKLKVLDSGMNEFIDHLEKSSDELDVEHLNDLIIDIENKRVELKKNFPREELLVYEEKFLNLTKQMKIKIDSVIEKLAIEQQNVQNELQKLYNKKKLTIYGR